jgi:hypothetical protein
LRGRDYLIKEAAAYFKQKGFQRLLQQMTEKYRSLGRWAGSVKLEDLTTEEQEALSSFFRQGLSSPRQCRYLLGCFCPFPGTNPFCGAYLP